MVVEPDTGEPLAPGTAGLLLLKGAGRMISYLDEPERTAAVLRDGWYVTGDIGTIDEDGFIRITDRLSRFSKIAGEMVLHLEIEKPARGLDGVGDCAVTASPDARRGERIALFYEADAGLTPDAIWRALNRCGLAKLWRPRRADIQRLDALPRLAMGKVDLASLKALAACPRAVL
jgi:acyl-[acyl-carrier-protein]-phospholipid O-acyltransferase/long-chain-fatty-acid--[acyl-carrier-protein] ligase